MEPPRLPALHPPSPAEAKPPRKRHKAGKTAAVVLDERVCYTVAWLERRAQKHEIKALLKRRYGTLPRSAERYLARARAVLLEKTGQSRAEHLQDALGLYVSVVRDAEASIRDKIMAQERIDTLLGLEAPLENRHAQSAVAMPTAIESVMTVTRRRDESVRFVS